MGLARPHHGPSHELLRLLRTSARRGSSPSAEDLLDFQQIVPDASPRQSPSAPKAVTPLTSEDAERANAVIVIVLTLACTALSLFDLFVLALGS